MGHASHVLCMAISSDGKYLVWGQEVERWPWGVFSQGPGGRVSCPDVPCWVKAAPASCWVKNGSLGHPKPIEWEWRQELAVGLQGASLRSVLLFARLRETGTS